MKRWKQWLSATGSSICRPHGICYRGQRMRTSLCMLRRGKPPYFISGYWQNIMSRRLIHGTLDCIIFAWLNFHAFSFQDHSRYS